MPRIICGIVGCVALLSITSDIRAADAPVRPNIIYVMTDDLGYGDIGCFGQQRIRTPHIDRLAAEGMKLTSYYAGCTVCRPSRLVLWTGKHTGHTAISSNAQYRFKPSDVTVAELLKEAGYATGGVGKWAMGGVGTTGHPNQNGFDFWMGYLNQSNAHNYYPTFLWENDQQVTLPGNVIGNEPAGRGRVASKRVSYSHDFMTNAALNFIHRKKDNPFLLHIHLTIPHANNEGGRVNGDGMEVPEYGIYANKDWPAPEKGFAAMITRMDADVGRLMKLLKELGIDEKTLVVFTSDNGPHNEGGHKHEFFNSNGDLKGFKRSMHEGGYRVPMIARWPGSIEPARVSSHPSAFQDFLPTACALAGAKTPSGIDGISYLPTLLGNTDKQAKHDYLYCASLEGATSVGVRFGKWKLVLYRSPRPGRSKKTAATSDDSGNRKPDWRLYDLSNDIGEETNVASQHPRVVAEILALLKRDGLQ